MKSKFFDISIKDVSHRVKIYAIPVGIDINSIAFNRDLLQKAHAALKPGGKVAIFDQVEGKVLGSAANAIVRLVGLMFFLFANGRTFTRDELTNILNDTNFNNIRFHPLRQAPGSSLLVAQK